MPGPVVKKSTTFREAVPRPLQGLYDYFTDDPMGGLSPVAIAAKAPASIVGALRGLHKSIPIGREVAEEAVEMSQAMKSVEPFAQRMAAHTRTTPHRLGHRPQLSVPKAAKGLLEWGAGPTPYPTRPQSLIDKYVSQRTFEEGTGLSPFKQKPGGGPLGSEISKEIRLGIESPKVRSAADLPVVAGAAKSTTTAAKKPLSGKYVEHALGSSKSRGMFSDDEIRAIRKEVDAKGFSEKLVQQLATKRGASPATIRDIAKRMSYVHVK